MRVAWDRVARSPHHRLLQAGAAVAVLVLPLFFGFEPRAAVSHDPTGAVSPGGVTAAPPSHVVAKRKRKARKPIDQPRIVAPPRFEVLVDPPSAAVGGHILVTVRLAGGSGGARKAALHVGTDPAVMSFVGYRPTGRGALEVAPASRPGDIVIYRSSVPEGFAPVEDLVTLEYAVVAPGASAVALQDVRLLDAGARDVRCTYEGGSLISE
jgi:hypothetical protein